MSIFASPLFFRIFVGLFLSAMVAWSYRRSRRCERGAPVSMAFLDAPAGHKYTYVYFDHLTLPIALGVYLLLILLMGPGNFGIVAGFFMGAILTISIYFGLLLLLLPLLRRFFSSHACAVLWLLPTFLFYLPSVPDKLACDELVLEGLGREERQAYARLLLSSSGKAPGFTSCLSAAGRTMRYRLKNVVEPRRRLPGTLLLAAVMFLCVMGYGLVIFSI